MEGQIPLIHAEQFILGGKAFFSFYNEKTGNKFYYYVKEKYDGVWYVYKAKRLAGDTSVYLGTIFRRDSFKRWGLCKTSTPDIEKSIEVFAWCWLKIRELSLPQNIIISHLGRCGMCGKTLKDPESIAAGYGPTCRGRK
jgi:hypothetical protein